MRNGNRVHLTRDIQLLRPDVFDQRDQQRPGERDLRGSGAPEHGDDRARVTDASGGSPHGELDLRNLLPAELSRSSNYYHHGRSSMLRIRQMIAAIIQGTLGLPYKAPTFWLRIKLLVMQPTWWMEVSIAASLTTWAIICLATSHGIQHNRSYQFMFSIWPLEVWARLALAAGLFHVVALVINGASPYLNGHNWRAVASFLSAWFISFIILDFFMVSPTPAGLAFFVVPLVFDLLALAKNVRRTA